MNTNFMQPEEAVMPALQAHTRPPLQPANCVCCGEPGQTGRYRDLPVCFPCYETGLLRDWFNLQGKNEMPHD